MIARLVVAASAFAFVACCHPFTSPPMQLCVNAADGGQGVLRATVFASGSNMSCSVSADAGVLTFEIAGTDCTAPSTNPVVPIAFTECDVSHVAAGRYTTTTFGAAGGTLETVTLPLGADSGIADCR